MDYYQGVVAEYLRANRNIFLNTEFCLLNELSNDPERRKLHWFVDILAADFEKREVILCEVTYARTMAALLKRLSLWSENWGTIKQTLQKDAYIPTDWSLGVWLFVPDFNVKTLEKRTASFPVKPRITALEKTAPWLYQNWDGKKLDVGSSAS
jgi:hypothetical protein